MDQDCHHECGKYGLEFQVSRLGDIFVSSKESTHRLNIHVQLIWRLPCNFILVACPIFHLAKLSPSWIVIITNEKLLLNIHT